MIKHSIFREQIEYSEQFKPMADNNIVKLNNTIQGAGEVFSLMHNGQQYYIQRLAHCIMFPMAAGIEQMKATVAYFQNMDKSFESFLGIGGCIIESDAVKEIQRKLDKEKDGAHKYYLIQKQFGEPVGIFYIYGYHKKYNRCSIAIGLSAEERGVRLTEKIALEVCKELFSQGLVRISLETETTNISSLKCCERLCDELGFEKEGILRNLYGVGIDSIVYSLLPEDITDRVELPEKSNF